MSEKSQPAASPEDDDISLNDALSDLENILDGRVSKEEAAPDGVPVDEQYSIPLLDDVVVPGTGIGEVATEIPSAGEHNLDSVEDDQSQAVIKRLTNEIEVIVQSSVEEAVKKASKEITARVRKHVNIILPEILDEIVDIKTRKNQP